MNADTRMTLDQYDKLKILEKWIDDILQAMMSRPDYTASDEAAFAYRCVKKQIIFLNSLKNIDSAEICKDHLLNMQVVSISLQRDELSVATGDDWA